MLRTLHMHIVRATAALGCAAGLALVAVSCGPPTTEVTLADDGGSITVTHPARVVAVLDANPQTEYFWVLDKLNQGVLRFKYKELVTLEHESKFGGNKFRKFTFETVGPGTTAMEIEFSSLWEDDDEGDDIATFNLTVIVE